MSADTESPRKLLTYRECDNGNCRVYYTHENRLFCWQSYSRKPLDAFRFYVCSRDGEPSHEVDPLRYVTPAPTGDESTEAELRDFLALRTEYTA